MQTLTDTLAGLSQSCFAAARAAAVAGLLLALPAGAVTISANQVAGPLPGAPGNGLRALHWDVEGDVLNIARAEWLMVRFEPTASFRATLIDYPNGSDTDAPNPTTTLQSFLGTNAAELQGHVTGPLEYAVFRFFGYLAVGAPGDLNFAVGSDDGMRLRIGDQVVTQFDGTRGFEYSAGVASFSAPGLYPIDLLFFENGTRSGIEFRQGLNGPLVPTSALYADLGGGSVTATPEPRLLLPVGLALALAALRARTHSRAATARPLAR